MIHSQNVWSLAVALVFGAGMYGCASLPESSRTAAVHDVKLEEKLSADNILVQPGDEIRWVNSRKLNAKVQIPGLKSDDLSCQRGFTNWMGSLQESVPIRPNETVSLCFNKPTVVNYNVRAETSLGGGDQVLPGVVRVGRPLGQ
jgi:plastocyanin